jgi:hypothetical protein
VSVSVAVEGPPTIFGNLQICLSGLPSDVAEKIGDVIMEGLLTHPRAVDPIVTSDLDSGELLISFEFEATGNIQVDGPQALGILAEAVDAQQAAEHSGLPAFKWQDWWQDGGKSPGTVQYPLALSV